MKALEHGGGHGRLAVLRELFGLDEVPEEAAGSCARPRRTTRPRASPPRCASCAAARRREDRHPRQRPRARPGRRRRHARSAPGTSSSTSPRPATATARRSTRSAGSASSTTRCCAATSTSPCTRRRTCRRISPRASSSPPCRPARPPSTRSAARRRWTRCPHGARVGTASPAARARSCGRCATTWTSRDLRGNVDTRLGRLHAGDYDAIVLALAGLRAARPRRRGDGHAAASSCPCAGQGALLLTARAGDDAVLAAARALDDPADPRLPARRARARPRPRRRLPHPDGRARHARRRRAR